MRNKHFLWAITLVFLAVNIIVWSFVLSGAKDNVLRVAFLDVGQGDAIFIESPAGIQLLVDGGPNLGVLRQIGKQMSFFDRSIDGILATHPDADHIGGLPEILDRFKVSDIYLSGIESGTPVFEAYRENISNEDAENFYVLRGGVIDLGGGAYAEVLFPDRHLSQDSDPNTSSIVLRLSYGRTSFLLTGDSPKEVEEYLALLDGSSLASDVLKAGHHGSRTSTSKAFVSAVSPEYAVISAGCNNRYGHPHQEVLDNLKSVDAKVLLTCESNSVVFESDGQDVWLKN